MTSLEVEEEGMFPFYRSGDRERKLWKAVHQARAFNFSSQISALI